MSSVDTAIENCVKLQEESAVLNASKFFIILSCKNKTLLDSRETVLTLWSLRENGIVK